jgi:translocator protein
MKLYYIIIPLITIITSSLGSLFTSKGLTAWYKTINLPSFTPPGSTIGLVWTTIFILATISAIIVWGNKLPVSKRQAIAIAFLVNAVLNILWSYLFFGQHLLFAAFIEALVLEISVLVLIFLIYPVSKISAYLLIPYSAWVAFASYLTYLTWFLNK